MGFRAINQFAFIFLVITQSVLAGENVIYVCNTYPCREPNRPPVFNDKIFDLTNKSAPKVSKGIAGTERYFGEELDYHPAQRAAWMKECKPKFYEGMSSFRECFNIKASENSDAEAKRRDEIERRMNAPLRNMPREGKELGARRRRSKAKFVGMPR